MSLPKYNPLAFLLSRGKEGYTHRDNEIIGRCISLLFMHAHGIINLTRLHYNASTIHISHGIVVKRFVLIF